MGDRTTLSGLPCGKCFKKQDDVHYAPSSGLITYTCKDCKTINEISTGYRLIPITKKQEKQLMKDNGFV